jgi:hypothetical protein
MRQKAEPLSCNEVPDMRAQAERVLFRQRFIIVYLTAGPARGPPGGLVNVGLFGDKVDRQPDRRRQG